MSHLLPNHWLEQVTSPRVIIQSTTIFKVVNTLFMSEVVLNLKLQEKSSLASFGNISIYMDAYEAKQKKQKQPQAKSLILGQGFKCILWERLSCQSVLKLFWKKSFSFLEINNLLNTRQKRWIFIGVKIV